MAWKFTLVLGIDSSAVDTIVSIPKMCGKFCKIKICIVRGSIEGFPCEIPLSGFLETFNENCLHSLSMNDSLSRFGLGVGSVDCNSMFKLVDSLDQGLQWCENQIVVSLRPDLNPIDPYLNREFIRKFPIYLHEMYLMHSNASEITRMLSFFREHSALKSTVLWKQGDASNFALLLVEGELLSALESEAGTIETIRPGALVGDYGLVDGSMRLSTVFAVCDIKYLLLSEKNFKLMKECDPSSALIFSSLCIKYLGMRIQHVGNRIW